MALTADRNTSKRAGKLTPYKVAATTKIYAGSMVALNGGYAVPGSTATTLTYLGRAEEYVDNSTGAAGDKTVLVARGEQFKWGNSATDPVVQADVGADCYIVDDETVSHTDTNQSVAGKVVAVEADGVWVE